MASVPNLHGKVAVVTGAASGIGAATARLLARHGARVHVVDIDGEGAQRVAAGIGGAAAAHQVDTTDPQALETLAERVFAADGAVDILHNNAGVGHAADIASTTAADWRRVIDVNVLGVAYGVTAFVPRMLAQGRSSHIVNTASGAGLVPLAQMVPYTTSKFAVVGMSEAMHAELSPQGIKVTALCPGVIDTNIVATSVMRGEAAEKQDRAVAFYRKRGVSPDVVAAAVLDVIGRHRLVVHVPVSHVLPGALAHRISPRLTQAAARNGLRIVTR